MKKLSVKDLDLRGKRVLVRVDFNVPVRNGRVMDDWRIERSLPTIRYLLERGARPILVSHLGRPKGKPDPECAMDPVARRLEELLRAPVLKLDAAVGDKVEEAIAAFNEGVVLLENSRFYLGETKNDPEFSRQLASLADLYVDDAFAVAHRTHATVVGVAELLPAAAGLLMEEELDTLDKVRRSSERPFVAVLGGAKVSDKLGVIESLLELADTLLIGGAMCFTFFKALGYEIGNSLVEDLYLTEAKRLINEAGEKIVLPVDVVAAAKIEENGPIKVVKVEEFPTGLIGLDIGPETVEEFKSYIAGAKTVFWNGPMGVFEIDAFAKGTEGVARAVAESGAASIVGGGDVVAAVRKFGLESQMSFISTGGGASLEYVEGTALPGVVVLPEKGSL
jgi:phosphoglycerate kinase